MANVSATTNPSHYSNATLFTTTPTVPSEYNDVEIVLLGVAMAILVLAIVFGKF